MRRFVQLLIAIITFSLLCTDCSATWDIVDKPTMPTPAPHAKPALKVTAYPAQSE